MKTLKTILVMFLLLFASNVDAQFEKSLVKNFSASNSNIVLNLPGEIETKHWSGNEVKITIKVSSNNEMVLNSLVQAGRYNLTSISEGDLQIISMPKSVNKVKVRGEEITEKFKFEITLPNNVTIVKSEDLLK